MEQLFCGGFCLGIFLLLVYVSNRPKKSSGEKTVSLEEKMWPSRQEDTVEDNAPPEMIVVGNLADEK